MQKDFYRIIKTDSDLFVVDTPEGHVSCRARKKNKKGEILAGDFVKLSDGVIQEVLSRKNRLIRPAVTNVDQVLLIVCSIPKPDFFLLDKAIINCLKHEIEPIICINKSDINDESFIASVSNQYIGRTIICTSALTGKTDSIKKLLPGKLTCLAGQSAVGKSSIVSTVLKGEAAEKEFKLNIRIGELSAIERGKNTTTSVELYEVCGGFLADTPGFGLLDFQDIKSAKLGLYYPEFDQFRDNCRYNNCTHTKEPDCAVSAAINLGLINKDRYNRYVTLFEELQQQEISKFKN